MRRAGDADQSGRRANRESRAYLEVKQTLGRNFEKEIREQPQVWLRIAQSNLASNLAAVVGDQVILLGSGSSLCVAQLGALALRRRGVSAHALAASEARLDHNAYIGKTVIAISQSGRSSDVLSAVDCLTPAMTVALTNDAKSPLANRATLVLDVMAGVENAVPASKSVTACTAVLLWAASIVGADEGRSGDVLQRTASQVESWLASDGVVAVSGAAENIARRSQVAVLGSDYGQPVAREIALKLKEASYLHAEGFAAGEFRHGSVSMVDDTFSVLGIVDEDALPAIRRPLLELQKSGAVRYVVGSDEVDGIPCLGARVETAYNTLAWLVTGQLLALFSGRTRGIDSDHPRGLTKALVNE